MQHIPKQSHYVRCPALKLLCTNLCGPLTKNFGDAWPKLNASFNKPNKARVPSLNPKQSEISPLNGEVVYNVRKMLVSTKR